MLIRIVRMTFQSDKVNSFLEIFNQTKYTIRNFPGCVHLELLQDANLPCVYYTYSYWDDEKALENYRRSMFFKETWAKTKSLFADKPQAFSLWNIETIN